MKKLICAIMAVMCVVCVANAGKFQKALCGNTGLSNCIKHYDKQCESKNYAACTGVGDLYFEQKQYGKAKKYYEMVCDKANSKDSFQVELINGSSTQKAFIESMQGSCFRVAMFYYNGDGAKQDFVKSLKYYNKACDLGSGDGCAVAGAHYQQGQGTKKDLNRAIDLYTKACDLENGDSCAFLGTLYLNGSGVKKDPYKAKELYDKACALGVQFKYCEANK